MVGRPNDVERKYHYTHMPFDDHQSEQLPARSDGLPTLSVVVPAFNEAGILEACLESLLAMDDPAEEIIVVDNSSTDDSAAIAASFPTVRVLSEARQGITYARTTGFDAARGELIARIDADSRVTRNWATLIRQRLAPGSGLDAVGGGAAIAELSPAAFFWFAVWYRGFRWWHQRSIGVRPMIYGFNGAMRTSAWRQARELVAMDDQQVSEDLDLTIALLRSGHRLTFEPRLLVKAHLFRSIDREKLERYYRTDSLTLARHCYGNPKRRAALEAEASAQ